MNIQCYKDFREQTNDENKTVEFGVFFAVVGQISSCGWQGVCLSLYCNHVLLTYVSS